MELMNEEDPQMLQQQADQAAIKANRGGTPDRTFTPGSTISNPMLKSAAQMKDFSKFNNIAQYTPPPTAMLSSEQSAKMDTDNDGDIDGGDLKTLRNNK